MGIRRGIGQFRRRISAFVACRFPSPAASLSSLHDQRTGIAMTAFSFVTRHVFAWCVFYLVVLLMWTSFGLPEFPVVLLWMITLAFVIPDVISHIPRRSEEHTSELQSLMRISYAVFCLKKKKHN